MFNKQNNLIIITILITMIGNGTQALNTLRDNELKFSAGLTVQDNVNDAGMQPLTDATLGLRKVCYDQSDKVGCETDYIDYYPAFVTATQPAWPGTINITLEADVGAMERQLKILVKGVETKNPGNAPSFDVEVGGIEGYSEAASNMDLKLRANSKNYIDMPRRFSHLQAAKTKYDESLWIYENEDQNTTGIDAFESLDLSLKQINPLPIGINAICESVAGCANTYITQKFQVMNLPDNDGGAVCVNDPDSCDSPGLFVNGNVTIDALFGSLGNMAKLKASNSNVEIEDTINQIDVTLNFDTNKNGIIDISPVEADFTGNNLFAFIAHIKIKTLSPDQDFPMLIVYMVKRENYADPCSEASAEDVSNHAINNHKFSRLREVTHTLFIIGEEENAVYDQGLAICIRPSIDFANMKINYELDLAGYVLPTN